MQGRKKTSRKGGEKTEQKGTVTQHVKCCKDEIRKRVMIETGGRDDILKIVQSS